MQKITVKEIRGPLGKGEKKFYAVKDPQGAEFTTFDPKIAEVTPGSVIEAEIEVKGQYVNLTEWKLLTAAPAGAGPAPGNGPYKRDTEGIRFEYELKAYLDKVKNASIEAQTAFNGIVKLAELVALKDDPKEAERVLPIALWQKAMQWAESRLDTSMAQKAPPEAPKRPKAAPEKAQPSVNTNGDPEGESSPGGFENLGQLLTWAFKVHGYDKAMVMEILGIKADADLPKINLLDAHVAICDYVEMFGK